MKYGLDPQEPQALAGMSPDDPGFGVEDPRWHGTLTLADGTSERIPTERGRYLAFYEGGRRRDPRRRARCRSSRPTRARASRIIERVRADAAARSPAGAAPAA